jgi:ATP-dependent Clp protease protease subunit
MRDTVHPRARQLAARHRQATGRRPFHAEAVGTRGSLYVYDVIGEDWWTGGGVTAKSVQEALDGMKGAAGLDIYINSPGGDIFEAKAIFAQVRRFQGERVVYVDGIAASAATFIAMAGDRIITAPAATWMIHEVWARTSGRASDFRAMADTLDLENRTFAETYASRSGSSVEDVLAWMAAETWMNATQAKERGFTDEIAEAETDSADADVAAALVRATSTLRGLAG